MPQPFTTRLACGFITVLLLALVFPVSGQSAEDPPRIGAVIDPARNVRFPVCPQVVDVTRPPYLAKGDGRTDDTDAIQRALSDVMGQHKLLYFPNGTYLISRTLRWSKQNSAGQEAWGFNFLQGQSATGTIIRLKDSTFTDASQPQSMMWCGGFGSADWFHNYVQDLAFDVGDNNPGAVGLEFYSNNSGAVRHCRFLAGASSGLVGLDLIHRDMNGPLLVSHCEVVGFARGIRTGHAVNSQTFEHVTLTGQREFGFDNEGQTISIRGLASSNAVPAVRSYGTLCLIEAQLSGSDGAKQWPAIINYNGGRIFVRDIDTTGYARALATVATPDWFAAVRGEPNADPLTLGPQIREFCSSPATSPFGSELRSLRLDVKEPPEVPADEPEDWANVDDFGADPTGQNDSSAAIQRAMDSGATTIFLPGSYALQSTVIIRGKVRRVVGLGGSIDYFGKTRPDLRIADGDAPCVVLEHFHAIHGGIDIDTARSVVFRSVCDGDLTFTPKARRNELFFEDFVTHELKFNGQQVWARQLNVENEGTHVLNRGSQLWVLGYKTERGGTLVDTRAGGRSEILGGFSYTTTAGGLAPMFVTDNSSVFAYFAEICFNGDPFQTLIRETQRNAVKVVKKDEGQTVPYVSGKPSR